MGDERNWAGNFKYNASEILEPETVGQVQETVARSRRLKVLGTRHSFNSIADTSGSLISLQKLDRVIELDRLRQRVTVEAGIRYGELCRYLHDHGFALHNLASLPHISVAGACATATHGSGVRNGNLATAVHSLELVQANGEKIIMSRDQHDGDFYGGVVGLGGLGVVTKVTLDVIPAFQMSQTVYENLPLARLNELSDEIFTSAYSVSLFTDWKESRFNQVWAKRKLSNSEDDDDATVSEYYGAPEAKSKLHPVPGYDSGNCSEQLGIPGPWHERLPHFHMEFTPSAGEELQSEYFVPRKLAYQALCAVDRIKERIAPLLYTSEIRTIAADELWMSPSYKQDSVGIHFTWKADWEGVRAVLPLIEEQLEPFGVRPHWGKLFTMQPARVQSRYEMFPDFQRLLQRLDPQGKFRNEFLDRYIYPS